MDSSRLSDLERALVALRPAVDFPATPDLTASVAVRIRTGARPQPIRRPLWPRLALGAGLAAIAFAAVLLFSPGVRTAVADFLGIGGVEITVTESPPPARIADELDLGEPSSLIDAAANVDFEIGVPTELGDPDEVYVKQLGLGTSMVSLVYAPRPGIPEAAETHVGVLLSEFRARIDRAVLEKSLFEGATAVEEVDVNGHLGFWIEGRPHVVNLLSPDGLVISEPPRLAGNVLVWMADGVTYRLESALTRARVMAIARSVP
jgi:hypothetical protein